MKRLLFAAFLLLFLFESSYAQNKAFLKSDFSLIADQNESDALYYRVQSEKQPNTYVIYDFSDAAIGKEETEEGQDGLLIRNILLVNPDLTHKEAHLIEERKYQNGRQSRIYDNNGKLLLEEKYNNGLLQYRAHYDESGKIKHEDKIVLAGPSGGFQGWNEFLAQNLKYPLNARRTGAQGTVYIRFDVDENGKPSNYEAIRKEGLHPELIKEAIRVISIYRIGWVPYSVNGIKGTSQVTIPIRFKLS